MIKEKEILTILYLIVIASFFSMEEKNYKINNNFVNNYESDKRNERSTPRSFVLPSSPAIISIEEKRNNFKDDSYKSVIQCKLVLFDKGFFNGNIENINDAKQIEAIILFQKNNELEVNGEFDKSTKLKLGCK